MEKIVTFLYINEEYEVNLKAPESYLCASEEDKERECGGCGPGRGLIDKLIPDKIYGLDISEACNIHDWCCFKYTDRINKKQSDKLFKDNLIAIIDSNTDNRILRKLRIIRAHTYYLSVRAFSEAVVLKGKI